MSRAGEAGSLHALYPLGEPHPFSISFQGLQYPGEVFLADQWDPAWGRPLEGDVYFRLVLLQHRRQVPSHDIQDSRIAACIPAKGPSRRRGHAGRELSVFRETQALYRTRRDPEAAVIRSYLERQSEELAGRLVGEEAARFAGGRIESPTAFSEDIDWYFAGSEPAVWFERLGSELLSWAYSALPLEHSLLPRTLTPEDVPRVYEAIFASSAKEKAPLGEFGPGLGLSMPDAPLVFDPANCRVFQQIRSHLESPHGELAWAEIHQLLAHASGLTRPLATLYLLSFVYYGQPETELGMAPDHGMTFRDGRPVRGTRLVRKFIPFLPWQTEPLGQDASFAQQFVSLGLPKAEVSWTDALQYTVLLCHGLAETEDASDDLSKQEQELLGSLNELARDVDRAVDVMDALSAVIPSPNAGRLRSALPRISQLCGSSHYRLVYSMARDAYESPEDLLADLEVLSRLVYLGKSLEEIVDMRAYVDGATVQSGHRELSFDRATLLEQISLPVLLASAGGWTSVRGHVREYQSRYRRAYVDYHARHQEEVSRLLALVEEARRKLHTLTLLNSIAELGPPMGTGLAQRYGDLERSIVPCHVNSNDLLLHSKPRCTDCQLALGEEPPAQELEHFLGDLNHELAEQNRRLSRVLVERILQDKIDKRLENLLKIVQASDLSALSNTLNEELTRFISQLLTNP